jgi:6-pyruvoyltetrahydropterin/6-carboxytetrahydropterin synthase
MSQIFVTRRYRFCAAHRLHTDLLSPEENRAVFGKCNNSNGHGHNYVVLVTIRAGTAESRSNLDSLDRLVTDTIIERFDHQDLNRDPAFSAVTTTGENLVIVIWNILTPLLSAGRLHKVGVIETRDNYFEYTGAM